MDMICEHHALARQLSHSPLIPAAPNTSRGRVSLCIIYPINAFQCRDVTQWPLLSRVFVVPTVAYVTDAVGCLCGGRWNLRGRRTRQAACVLVLSVRFREYLVCFLCTDKRILRPLS
jgi:hypothetical protein